MPRRGIGPHLRTNAIGLIALFIVLGGTALALPGSNTVNSGDIKDGHVRSKDVADETAKGALKAKDIPNPTRGISLPLASFIECNTDAGAFINFASGVDAFPDFVNHATNGGGFSLEFDATPGTEDEDTRVCTQLAVPQDIRVDDGGEFAITASRLAGTNPVESIQCGYAVNAGGAIQTSSVPTQAGVNTYLCDPFPAGPTKGSSLNPFFAVQVAGGTMNDAVRILNIEFRYVAEQ